MHKRIAMGWCCTRGLCTSQAQQWRDPAESYTNARFGTGTMSGVGHQDERRHPERHEGHGQRLARLSEHDTNALPHTRALSGGPFSLLPCPSACRPFPPLTVRYVDQAVMVSLHPSQEDMQCGEQQKKMRRGSRVSRHGRRSLI